MKTESNYSLLKHNTFGIDARCTRMIEYATTAEALAAAELLRQSDKPHLTLGAGSNLLLTGDYDGTVVHSAIKGCTLTQQADGQALLCCGSGHTWDDVVAWTVGLGYYDLACLSLIPGEVGASAVQNIGAYGTEAGQFISSIQAVDIARGTLVNISATDCAYAYRDSRFKHEWHQRYLITHVRYILNSQYRPSLDYGNILSELERSGASQHPTPLQLRQCIISIRNAKLPSPQVLGNAGSFFMNPIVTRQKFNELIARHPDMPHYYISEQQEKIPAGWLIDQCGWKGRRMQRAAVYDRQALVLVNTGGATGQEILQLCHAIQHDVARTFGIELKPEVNIV